jgi:hypothetical protein
VGSTAECLPVRAERLPRAECLRGSARVPPGGARLQSRGDGLPTSRAGTDCLQASRWAECPALRVECPFPGGVPECTAPRLDGRRRTAYESGGGRSVYQCGRRAGGPRLARGGGVSTGSGGVPAPGRVPSAAPKLAECLPRAECRGAQTRAPRVARGPSAHRGRGRGACLVVGSAGSVPTCRAECLATGGVPEGSWSAGGVQPGWRGARRGGRSA